MLNKIFVGWDPREEIAFEVCKYSIQKNTNLPVRIISLKQNILREEGIYKREHRIDKAGIKVDKIDGKPFSTEFSFTRFLVPFLASTGWVLFCDCDMMFRSDIAELIDILDDQYAIMVVKHNQIVTEETKMDGCVQQAYPRKNWSSFVLWNMDHLAHTKLTLKDVNTKSGSWLHQFSWLEDDEIGELPVEWNWLEGISNPKIVPKNVHFTSGGPWFPNYQNVAFAQEWRDNAMEML